MSKYTLDLQSAWSELERFAQTALVEMDERAHPDYEPEPSDEDEDEDAESDVADYSSLLHAIRRGWVTITDTGALHYDWQRPFGAGDTLVLDPNSGKNGWAYGRAMRALATTVTHTHKGRKKRDAEVTKQDTLGQGDAFLEILAELKSGTLLDIRSKRDRDIVTKITVFMVSEPQHSH